RPSRRALRALLRRSGCLEGRTDGGPVRVVLSVEPFRETGRMAETTELKVRGVNVRLHRAGTGPTVLFLHGAGGVPVWLPFFDALAEHHTVLVPEHPGFGGSDDPAWISSMSDLALFYLDLVEEEGLDGIHLIGNSLGGWLAAEILVRDRARFRSLVQLAPAGIRVKGVPC